jgi:hypothetical protein
MWVRADAVSVIKMPKGKKGVKNMSTAVPGAN